jgi:hypothetical protein
VLLKLLASSILLDSLKFALEPGLRGLLVHAPEVIQAEPAKLDPPMAPSGLLSGWCGSVDLNTIYQGRVNI